MFRVIRSKTWKGIQEKRKKDKQHIDDLTSHILRKNSTINALESYIRELTEKYQNVLGKVKPHFELFSSDPNVSIDIHRAVIEIQPVARYIDISHMGEWFIYTTEKDLECIADEMLEFSRKNVREAYKKGIQEIIRQKLKREKRTSDVR